MSKFILLLRLRVEIYHLNVDISIISFTLVFWYLIIPEYMSFMTNVYFRIVFEVILDNLSNMDVFISDIGSIFLWNLILGSLYYFRIYLKFVNKTWNLKSKTIAKNCQKKYFTIEKFKWTTPK